MQYDLVDKEDRSDGRGPKAGACSTKLQARTQCVSLHEQRTTNT